MADIRSDILSRYGIDIAQDNIFKLYQINNADISPQELFMRIQDTHKRWNTSANGTNEKLAQRDRARLANAQRYEAILQDVRLRKAVYQFYEQNKKSNYGGGSVDFAREYFGLIATTKHIKKADVDFFFKYYTSERKNKKAILEMLSKEMKISGLGKEDKYSDDEKTEEKGKKDSKLIVNLFQESTILKIRSAIDQHEVACASMELCQRYPGLQNGLYAFIEINNIADVETYRQRMEFRKNEVFAIRQDKGTEYLPLVDMFNTLISLVECKDVRDNFSEFKLLLKYPNLTPYMFSFVDMRPNTVKGLVNIARRNYPFRDETDFLLNYFKPIYDNFGISDSAIGSLLKAAEKRAKQNKVLNTIDEKLGKKKNKNKDGLPFGAKLIHWLLYWPIYIVYLFFEITKLLFTKLHHLTIPVFVLILGLLNWILPKKVDIDNLLILRKIVFKNEWISYLSEFLGESRNGVMIFIVSLCMILFLLSVYLLPSLFVAWFVGAFAEGLNKSFDWIGLERTFKSILAGIKQKTLLQYRTQRKTFVRSKLLKIVMNLISVLLVYLVIHFTPIVIHNLSVITGYGQPDPVVEQDVKLGDTILNKTNSEKIIKQSAKTMIITESASNIRMGPGVNYDVIVTVSKGDRFTATGNQEIASNGRIWYEIYIDEEMKQTGWASEKVIEEEE